MRDLRVSSGRAAFLAAAVLAAGSLWASAPASAQRRRAPARPAAKAAPKPAATAVALPIARLAVEPASATLTGPRAEQHFLATATLKDGSTLDVTDRAAFR